LLRKTNGHALARNSTHGFATRNRTGNAMPVHAHDKFRTRLPNAACLACAAAIAIAAPAHAATEIGWLWANNPTLTTPYAPDAGNSYNSSGGAITVTRLGTGFYQIDFAGLYSATGASNVQVTAATTSGYCTSAGWGTEGTGNSAQMWVACFAADGTNADSYFTLLYQSRTALLGTADKGLAFVLDDSPTSANYTPTNSYNSTGGTNTIALTKTGKYTVTLPGFAKAGGDVQVTAVNGKDISTNAARCKTSGWTNSASATTVDVLCFNSAGAAADEEFSLAYALAEPFAVDTAATADATFEWANNPTDTTAYTPPASRQFNSFKTGSMTSQNYGTGQYIANPPGYLPETTQTVLVTGYGAGSDYCNAVGWLPVYVACYAQGGTPANSDFDVTYQTSQ
jgi:hypothetical protein